MHITEVRIKLMENSEDRLRGFCSITFDDCFVVRDLKIIEGNNGPFVAMPSRKLTSNCCKCRSKNHLRARFCNQCGTKQKSESVPHSSDGRARLYADIAHPVNASCREMIQAKVIEEFSKEIDLAKVPGYVSRYDDDYTQESKANEKDQSGKGRQENDQNGTKQTRADSAHQNSNSRHEKQDENSNAGNPAVNPPDQPTTDSGFGQGIFE